MAKVKCRTCDCKSCCCYNIPFDNDELERFADKIVNPVLFYSPIGAGRHGNAIVAFTNEDIGQNKCPFLRSDYKCNIYENRPDICRMFGEIPELTCKYRK